jgi:multiple sugar transport system substrate-binding protein
MGQRKPSRRDFLRIMGAGAGAALLAACETQVEVTREVEKIVKETVVEMQTVVEKETVLETVIVEGTPEVMEHEVTREVEVEKVVTATAPPALSGEIVQWSFPLTQDDMSDIWEPITAQFNERYPEIKVEHSLQPWGGRREKMLTAYAGGEAPDLAYVNADTITLFGSNEVLLPLNDLISQEVWDDLPQEFLPGLTWEGNRILMPMISSVSAQVAIKSDLEAIGWDPEVPIVTWDDHRALGAMAKEHGYYVQSLPADSIGFWISSVWQAGGTCLNEDQTKSLANQQAGLEAAGLYKEYYENGWVPEEFAAQQAGELDSNMYFIQGEQVLTMVGSPNSIRQAVDARGSDLEWVVVPPRKYKEQAITGNAAGFSIFNTTESVEPATAWLNFLARPEISGFYASVAANPVARQASLKYWNVDPLVKEVVAQATPYARINKDFFTYYQERKVILIPHVSAIVLGEETVEEAMNAVAAEIDTMIQQQQEASG